ncbi:MAG: phosphoglucomutase/phosphomannomutase family protein [Anaerolineales bacterium]|nr:phosphoglucomutase/phosphomannomutase family protein [Anaerolineales bacterium]MCW5856536.1 phosphoglucomutase/phosphomannomutase family protein [Anaerolineales bacterium]
MPIHFGTDGWRAVISDTFTFSNLRMVAQAIADATRVDLQNGAGQRHAAGGRPHLVVGFDTRFLSDRFARDVACVLAADGLRVYLAQADAPTPAISYAVKQLGALGGVMITASHNPPRYNGIKLKAAYGGSASSEMCKRVEIYLNDNENRGRSPALMEYDDAVAEGMITRFSPIEEYETHLRSLIDFDLIARHNPKVLVDSMHGSGRGAIARLLAGKAEVHEIRGDMNPGFGGVHPEPIMPHLQALADAIAEHPGYFGVATDGDADRVGAMDEAGEFVDPHKIMALALRYLVQTRGLSGKVVRTVSTTRMIDRLAEKYGLQVVETPVGFNHIADHMLAGDVLIGGEESGGISFKGHIPEGDGVLMGLLVVEMVAAAGGTLRELVADLLAEVGPAHYARTDLRLKRPVEKKEMSERLRTEAPSQIGGEEVLSVATNDGTKYILADDSWLLIRPSGTEPVLRVYAEGRSPQMVKALMAFGEGIAAQVA